MSKRLVKKDTIEIGDVNRTKGRWHSFYHDEFKFGFIDPEDIQKKMKRVKISGSCAVLAAFFLLAASTGVSADTIALWDQNLENRIPIDGDSWSAITDTKISIGESYPADPTSDWIM